MPEPPAPPEGEPSRPTAPASPEAQAAAEALRMVALNALEEVRRVTGPIAERLASMLSPFKLVDETGRGSVPRVPVELNRALTGRDLISGFVDSISGQHADLARNPERAGALFTAAVQQHLAGEGVSDPALQRLDIVFDKNANERKVDFSSNGRKVTKNGADFVFEDGTKCPADQVRTRLTLPESMLSGDPKALAKELMVACMEQTSRGGPVDRPALANIRRVVDGALSDHVSLPGVTVVGGGAPGAPREGGGLNQSAPAERPREAPIRVVLSNAGVRYGDVPEVTFRDIWEARVREISDRLAAEEAKQGTERNDKKINEIKKELAYERNFLARLSDPAHAEHGKYEALARDRMREVLKGHEEGGRGNARSRVAIMVTLATALAGLWAASRPREAAPESPDSPSQQTRPPEVPVPPTAPMVKPPPPIPKPLEDDIVPGRLGGGAP